MSTGKQNTRGVTHAQPTSDRRLLVLSTCNLAQVNSTASKRTFTKKCPPRVASLPSPVLSNGARGWLLGALGSIPFPVGSGFWSLVCIWFRVASPMRPNMCVPSTIRGHIGYCPPAFGPSSVHLLVETQDLSCRWK